MPNAFRSQRTGPVPFVVGLTGHRAIPEDQRDAVINSARHVLRRIERAHPSTRLFLASGLAAGADQLVSKLALDRGWELIALLPAELERYRKTLHHDDVDENAEDGFNKLWSEASIREAIIKPAEQQESNHAEITASDYARLGIELCNWSHVVMAVWDGQQGGLGGTGSVVQMALSGEPIHEPAGTKSASTLDVTTPFRQSRIYWIGCHNGTKTPRKGVSPGEVRILTPLPDNLNTTHSSFAVETAIAERVDNAKPISMNRVHKPGPLDGLQNSRLSLGKFNALLEKAIRRDSQDLLEELHQCGLVPDPSETHASVIQRAANSAYIDSIGKNAQSTWALLYATADSVSRRVQAKRKWMFRSALCLMGLGFAIFEFTTGPMQPNAIALGAFICITCFAKLVFDRIMKNADDEHITAREFAEHARVKMYLEYAHVSDIDVSDHMVLTRDNDDWVAQSLRTIDRIERVTSPTRQPVTSHQRIQDVKQYWLQGQERYFAKSANKELRHIARCSMCDSYGGRLALLLTLFAIVLLNTGMDPTTSPIQLTLFAAVLMLFATAIIKHIARYSAFQEHANRYAIARKRFSLTIKQIDRAIEHDQIGDARTKLRDIAEHALTENAEWYLLHSERSAQPDF